MSECQLEALLVRHPWSASREQIDLLDDWELLNVFIRPGEAEQLEYGTYWPVPDKDSKRSTEPAYRTIEGIRSYEDWYKDRLRSFNVMDEKMIELRWRNFVENDRQHGLAQRAELRRQMAAGEGGEFVIPKRMA